MVMPSSPAKKSQEVTPKKEAPSAAPTNPSSQDHQDMRALIQENIALSQQLLEQNKKIKFRLTMMTISTYLKFALILIPLIIAWIYLPPFLEDAFSQYQQLLGGNAQINVQDLLQ